MRQFKVVLQEHQNGPWTRFFIYISEITAYRYWIHAYWQDFSRCSLSHLSRLHIRYPDNNIFIGKTDRKEN